MTDEEFETQAATVQAELDRVADDLADIRSYLTEEDQ